jgi:signal transduction histidine kinase
VAVLWAVTAATMVYWVVDYPDSPAGLALLVALFNLGAHTEPPRLHRHAIGVHLVTLVVSITGALSPEEELSVVQVPVLQVMVAAAWVLGDNVRTRRAYLAELEQKVAGAEARRRAETDKAIAEERTRLARDLHDIVAHSLSVMVVQAGAARRLVGRDPAQVTEALGNIESVGRSSLDEMRRILGVLRGEDEATNLRPQPGLGDLVSLVEQCREAGLDVDVTTSGEPQALPPSVDVSAYRIVQESLTNTLKHAQASTATVHVTHEPEHLSIEIVDRGRLAPTPRVNGGGHGLAGMTERVESLGGTFEAGPRLGGGFRVRARLPLRDVR